MQVDLPVYPVMLTDEQFREWLHTQKDTWTAADCCAFLGISRDTFSRQVVNGAVGFPKHLAVTEGSRVWDAQEVRRWVRSRKGKPISPRGGGNNHD